MINRDFSYSIRGNSPQFDAYMDRLLQEMADENKTKSPPPPKREAPSSTASANNKEPEEMPRRVYGSTGQKKKKGVLTFDEPEILLRIAVCCSGIVVAYILDPTPFRELAIGEIVVRSLAAMFLVFFPACVGIAVFQTAVEASEKERPKWLKHLIAVLTVLAFCAAVCFLARK